VLSLCQFIPLEDARTCASYSPSKSDYACQGTGVVAGIQAVSCNNRILSGGPVYLRNQNIRRCGVFAAGMLFLLGKRYTEGRRSLGNLIRVRSGWSGDPLVGRFLVSTRDVSMTAWTGHEWRCHSRTIRGKMPHNLPNPSPFSISPIKNHHSFFVPRPCSDPPRRIEETSSNLLMKRGSPGIYGFSLDYGRSWPLGVLRKPSRKIC